MTPDTFFFFFLFALFFFDCVFVYIGRFHGFAKPTRGLAFAIAVQGYDDGSLQQGQAIVLKRPLPLHIGVCIA